MKNALAISLALICGLVLSFYDTRTDDTGVEVGLLLFASSGLAFLAPTWWWAIALLVGGFIPIIELGPIEQPHVPAGIIALGVTFVGALIGFAIARSARSTTAV
ncbi:MAG TPA: hypothetical protein VKR80_01010 [Candidatus Limnocylindria bacterium]|nr:hypothetical protein [Candidatus Limnocylindria bacterium]